MTTMIHHSKKIPSQFIINTHKQLLELARFDVDFLTIAKIYEDNYFLDFNEIKQYVKSSVDIFKLAKSKNILEKLDNQIIEAENQNDENELEILLKTRIEFLKLRNQLAAKHNINIINFYNIIQHIAI